MEQFGTHQVLSSFWYSLIRLGWVSWRIEQFLVLTHQTGMGFMENRAVSGTHSSDWDGFHGEWSSFWYSLIRLGWVSWRIEQFLVLTHQTGMGFMENRAVSGTHSSDWDGFHGE